MSVERTAYPRFKRLITAHGLHLFFAPTREEAAWAAQRMDSDGHQLALLLALRSYRRMDFELIDSQFRHVVRVAVSVREGAVSSATLLKRLRSGSHKNATYVAFREVGRVIRTVQLLRYPADAPLRRRVFTLLRERDLNVVGLDRAA